MVLFDLKKLGEIKEAEFVKRENRFVGICRLKNENFRCHIADSGRLKEILTAGRKVLVVKNRPNMKTDYKLLSAKMEDGWILLNTSLHSKIGKEAIKKGVLGFIPQQIKTEVKFGKSRIDYLIDHKTFVELKGCNLLIGKKCLFPDAPTLRGSRHLQELIEAVKKGYKAVILFIIMRKCSCFSPNTELDPKFSKLFYKALKSGVRYEGFRVSIDKDLRIVMEEKVDLCR